MRVMIVDDERMAAEELYDICTSHRLIDEAVSFDNPADALVYIAQNTDIDIAFLDIEMPQLDGFSLARELKERNSKVVIFFITAFNEYQDDAMDLQVFRYLSKPIDKNRLFRSLKEALREYNMESVEHVIETPTATLVRRSYEIVCVETKGRKTTVYTLDGTYESTKNMEYWQSVLVQPCYFVTNRSYIINMSYVSSFDRESVVLKYGEQELIAYLTKRKYTEFKDRQLLFWGGGH